MFILQISEKISFLAELLRKKVEADVAVMPFNFSSYN